MAGVDILATAFNGANAAFIADLYARWVERPDSVDSSFAELFEALNDEARSVLTDATGASWAPRRFECGRAGAGQTRGERGPRSRTAPAAQPCAAGAVGRAKCAPPRSTAFAR